MKKQITFLFIALFYALSMSSYAENVTVRVKVPTDWTEDVYLYLYWADQPLLDSWPGQLLTADADGYLSYSYDNTGFAGANAIINDNNVNNQQVEITGGVLNGGCFELTSWSTITPTTCPGGTADKTIRVSVPADYTGDLYLYSWYVYNEGEPAEELFGGWPGKIMDKDADGYFISYDASGVGGANGIINNDSGDPNQQINLADGDVLNGGCFELTPWSNISPTTCPGGTTDKTIRVSVPTDFTGDLFLYSWYVYNEGEPAEELFGGWPGKIMDKDADGYFISYDASGVGGANGIINNDSGDPNQQINLADGDVLNGGCFELTPWSNISPTTCPGQTPATPLIVGFKAPDTWTEVAIHIWEEGGATLTAWPGITLTEKDGFYSYTIDNYNPAASAIIVIFNNGDNGEQTENLVVEGDMTCWASGEITGKDDYDNDIWSATTTSCPGGTSVNDLISNDELIVYPNPTNDLVFLSASEEINNIQLFNSLGSLLFASSAIDGQISLAKYPAGIYFLSVTFNDGSKQSKAIIKQ